MATKQQIVETVVKHLRESVGTYTVGDSTYELVSEAVRPTYPNGDEFPMAIGWSDTYSNLHVNGIGNAVKTTDDGSGLVEEEISTTPSTAQFIITIQAPNTESLDVLYESVYRTFDKYQATDLKSSDFHDDCKRLSVEETQSIDEEDADDVLRRDQLTVELTFTRHYARSEDNIGQISLDTDGDDSTEYTITE